MVSSPEQVTRLLVDWRNGNRAALDELMPLVSRELRVLARRYMSREKRGHTWQTSDLLHEAYLRLIDQGGIQWQDRAHFFGIAATIMRHLLVDHARRHQRTAGRAQHIPLDEAVVSSGRRASDLVALDDALARLAAIDPRKAQIVELRYFGGMSAKEAALVVGVSEVTIKREWLKAKAWLYRELDKTRGVKRDNRPLAGN
jgi:RNA polymerase sigma-70 factor (ECF subfamily)